MSLHLKNVKKSYTFKNQVLPILKGVNLDLAKGESAAILGPSGSGKTTLLSILAGLETPDEGEVNFNGKNLFTMDEEARTRFRALNVGVVFQQFHLVPHLTAVENVVLPLEISGQFREKTSLRFEKAKELLSAVGLSHRLDHKPGELSGGECQRVAIARALVTNPQWILADEPSGNLDTKTGQEVMSLFFRMAKENSITTILVTHNESLTQLCQKAYRLGEGQLNLI